MTNGQDISVARGFREARRTTRRWARSFYFASLFLPCAKRHASYAVYAICRACDQSVDNTTDVPKAQSLSAIKARIDRAYHEEPLDDDVLAAFRKTVRSYGIPKRYFDDLIDGMSMDLHKDRYQNFGELYDYCYKVAGVVGLIMLRILGSRNEEAERYAVDLGVAMQLTNILRDVKEDYSFGRIYLPLEELEQYGLSEASIADERLDDAFQDFLRSQVARARKYYERAGKGIRIIDHIRCRFVVYVMKDLYSGILTVIERSGYDVFSRRAAVNRAVKVLMLLKVLLVGRYWKGA